LDFSRPGVRADFLRNPDQLIERCLALERGGQPAVVVVDEAPGVPAIFDAVQQLYDSDKTRWRFVLSGSMGRPRWWRNRPTPLRSFAIRHLLRRLAPTAIHVNSLREWPSGRSDRRSFHREGRLAGSAAE
jgi:hypothetical protein